MWGSELSMVKRKLVVGSQVSQQLLRRRNMACGIVTCCTLIKESRQRLLDSK